MRKGVYRSFRLLGICVFSLLLAGTWGCGQMSSREHPTLTPAPLVALRPSNIACVWANEGGDKVLRDELRATKDACAVRNTIWDGSRISLFGARNEVVSFNLILEAPKAMARQVV